MMFIIVVVFNQTALHLACKSGNIDLVIFLISLDKIDINAIDNIKTTKFYNILFLRNY